MMTSYLDEFNGRLSAGRQTEVEAMNGVVQLAFDDHASGLLRLTVYAGDPGIGVEMCEAYAKLNAAQLRRLIADLQAKLGCLTRDGSEAKAAQAQG